MRTLLRMLEDRDPGFLRVIYELWGLDNPAGSSQDVAQKLAAIMLQPDQLTELIESLPDPARSLIDYLVREEGRAPFAQIDRIYGPLREMGPGRRDREQPWRQPISALEMVWYRGLLGRAFADSPLGPQEFIFIPSDINTLLKPNTDTAATPLGHPAKPPANIEIADTSVVDDATTVLASFRKQPPHVIPLSTKRRQELGKYMYQPPATNMVVWLLIDLHFLQPDTLMPSPDLVGPFLEIPRARALQTLIATWKDSSQWNDLAALSHLYYSSSDWPNDPRLSRTAALALMRSIPIDEWWDLSAFLAAVKQHQPAFQRPGGDFQSWYLQDASGAFLNGIEHWESVDGAYLRYLIEGPIHWLGMADLGRSELEAPAHSFRLTPAWRALFDRELIFNVEEPDSKITIKPNGEVIVPRGADRVIRYQIARISSWEPPDRSGHHFHLTPGTLELAEAQGLSPRHILQLLEKAIDGELPPSVLRAVERWSQSGTEASLLHALLLRVEKPEILETLENQRSTNRYIAEVLTPTVAIIRETDWPVLRDAAARLGLFLEPPGN
jgi:hypothetical protein